MCFSAEASFAGRIIISAIGVATVTKVHKSSQIVFASIPLFFGVQQMVEGTLWLTIPSPAYCYIYFFNHGRFPVANSDPSVSVADGGEQEKKKDSDDTIGNGNNPLIILCLLFNFI